MCRDPASHSVLGGRQMGWPRGQEGAWVVRLGGSVWNKPASAGW